VFVFQIYAVDVAVKNIEQVGELQDQIDFSSFHKC